MCGRCMKTCPWNLEGLFSEAPFRWAASNIPKLAQPLAKLDDMVGRGGLNDVKNGGGISSFTKTGDINPRENQSTDVT